jgi:Mitochondrial carrier protein
MRCLNRQVTGKFSAVVDKVKLAGPLALYNGALASASATFGTCSLDSSVDNSVCSSHTPPSGICAADSPTYRPVQLVTTRTSEALHVRPARVLCFFPAHVRLGPSLCSCSWFATYNYLSEKIPKQETQMAELGRRAILGFCSSAVSDTCSNSIRVVKVYKQSHPEQLTYGQVIRNVLAESGVQGLMFRGLETKILANGLQGILFSILWKQFEEILFPKNRS